MTRLDIVRLLETCRDIEAHCAMIYGFYRDHFANDVELGQFWGRMHIEEENHVRQFTTALSMRMENFIIDTHVEKEKAVQMLHKIKNVYDTMLAHPPSAAEAVRSGILLERVLSDFHFNTLCTIEDESFKRLFDAMMLADKEHVAGLEQLYLKFSSDEVEPIW